MPNGIIVALLAKNDFSPDIVSWGNFGHGATSVKNSLRNHFGRINNV